MGRALAEILAVWVAVSIPAALIVGKVMARIADLAVAPVASSRS